MTMDFIGAYKEKTNCVNFMAKLNDIMTAYQSQGVGTSTPQVKGLDSQNPGSNGENYLNGVSNVANVYSEKMLDFIKKNAAQSGGESSGEFNYFIEYSKAMEEYQQAKAPYQECLDSASEEYSTIKSAYTEEANLTMSTSKEALDIEKEEFFSTHHYEFYKDENGDMVPKCDSAGHPIAYENTDPKTRIGEAQRVEYDFESGQEKAKVVTGASISKSTDQVGVEVSKSEWEDGSTATTYAIAVDYDGEGRATKWTTYGGDDRKTVVTNVSLNTDTAEITYSKGGKKVEVYSSGETAEERSLRLAWENKVKKESEQVRIDDKKDGHIDLKETPYNDQLSKVNSYKSMSITTPSVVIDGQEYSLNCNLDQLLEMDSGATVASVNGQDIKRGSISSVRVYGEDRNLSELSSLKNIADNGLEDLQSKAEKESFDNDLKDEIDDLRKIMPSELQGSVSSYKQTCEESFAHCQDKINEAYDASGCVGGYKWCVEGLDAAEKAYKARMDELTAIQQSMYSGNPYGSYFGGVSADESTKEHKGEVQSLLDSIKELNDSLNTNASSVYRRMMADSVGYSNEGEVTIEY